jgi:hypothetical protein
LAFFTKDTENDEYRDHIRSSARIAVFTGAGEDPVHWTKVGQSFQRFALQATALGIRNAHINQPVEVPGLRTEFARWLGVPDRRPDLVVWFGRGRALLHFEFPSRSSFSDLQTRLSPHKCADIAVAGSQAFRSMSLFNGDPS